MSFNKAAKKKKKDRFTEKIKIKASAAEALCLVQYLGLMIGDLIPEKSKAWKLYIILHEIILLLSSPRYVISDLFRIEKLITQHNTMYLQLFEKLKPKMHFATHIVRVMLMFGPLIHFLGMFGERKNRYLKNIAVSTTSRRNLPLTVAIKNQLNQCYINHFSSKAGISVVLGPLILQNDKEIGKFHASIKVASSYKYVIINEKKLGPGTVIINDIDDNGPHFVKIKKIFMFEQDILFLLCKIDKIYYNNKYRAYKVLIDDNKIDICSINSMIKYDVCLLVKKDCEMYVTMRYEV